MITQKKLKKLLIYLPETGYFNWLSSGSGIIENQVAGSLNNYGYRIIQINKIKYLSHDLVWLYMNGEYPDKGLDHINRLPDDNRISNLRLCSYSQNNYNMGLRSDNTLGIKGLSFSEGRKYCWCAALSKEGKRTRKDFKDKELAIEWLRAKREELHGEFTNHG